MRSEKILADPEMLRNRRNGLLERLRGLFGVFAGLVAGFLHSSVALNVGIVYSGMNLYNNGFAGGLVAAFMVPVILSFRSRMSRIKNEDIL